MFKILCDVKDCEYKIDENWGFCIPHIDKVGKVLCFKLKKEIKIK